MNVLFPNYNANIEPGGKKEKEEHTLARPTMVTRRDPSPAPLRHNAHLQCAAAVHERVPRIKDFDHDIGLVEHGGEMWQVRVEEWHWYTINICARG